jgi:hypothetical protein
MDDLDVGAGNPEFPPNGPEVVNFRLFAFADNQHSVVWELFGPASL